MSTTTDEPIRRILAAARWAPSGDNTQPWRFQIESDRAVVIHGSDTRDWCVYDLEGRASQIAIGTLLESIALAASREGLRARFELLPDGTEAQPRIRASFDGSLPIPADPLAEHLERRCTQRRPLSAKSLRPDHRHALAAAPGPGYRIVWVEGVRDKARMARLLFLNAGIRLTIREAYEVHRRIIEWGAGLSEDRIPERALGLNPVAVRLMHWAMASWERVAFLNRYMAGTLLPRIEMDVIPALACAAHFYIVAESPPAGLSGYLDAGRAVQRFWLAATGLGLQLQPEMTPLIFSDYNRRGIAFTTDAAARAKAARLSELLGDVIGAETLSCAVFAGRVGYGREPQWRSIRLPVQRLLLS